MVYTQRLIRNEYLQRHTFSWKEIDVIELTVACLIRTGKILVSNSIDLQKKKKRTRPIFPHYGLKELVQKRFDDYGFILN